MKERPILFSGPMVHALLAGTKTQTRRAIRGCPDPREGRHEEGGCSWSDWKPSQWEDGRWVFASGSAEDVPIGRCPFGAPGDRLWVRETWRVNGWDDGGGAWIGRRADGQSDYCEISGEDDMEWIERESDRLLAIPGAKTVGEDDEERIVLPDGVEAPWRPSIFMRRWMSRITLEVTEVRIERVQAISEDDSTAEGIVISRDGFNNKLFGAGDGVLRYTARDAYRVLWDSINGKRQGCAWAANPWVWCVSFRRVTPCGRAQ